VASAALTNIAQQVLGEFVKRGEVAPSSKEEMAGRVERYRDWIESYVSALLFEELGRLGKVSEFRVFPDGDDAKRDEFFRRVIPHFEEFQNKAMRLAAGALLGKPKVAASQSRDVAA